MGLNPWPALRPRVLFVLDGDRAAIDVFNREASDSTRVQTALLPEPFVGRLAAPIILLLLNPGVSDEDFALHRLPKFRDRVRRCHRQEAVPYPNYHLDPAVTGPGARWEARWVTRVTRPLLKEFGAQTVAANVTLLEYFPYHTRRFGNQRGETRAYEARRRGDEDAKTLTKPQDSVRAATTRYEHLVTPI
jgi:hypothetical protein